MDINNIKKTIETIKITGVENSGKTTFAAELYKSLFAKTEPEKHLLAFWPKYIFKEVEPDDCIDCKFCQYIKGKNNLKISSGKYVDFMSIMEYENETVIFISEGDDCSNLKDKLNLLLQNKNHEKYNKNKEIMFDRQKRITLIYCVRSNREMAECNTSFEKIYNLSNKKVIELRHSYETIAKSISKRLSKDI
jgi:uncharacterized UBP type Zn finger protein